MRNAIIAGVVAVVAIGGGAAYWYSTQQAPPPAATANASVVPGATPGAAAPKAPAGQPAVTADDHILGKPDAPVTIIEYASLTCPHCAHFHKETLPKIKEEWIDTGKAKLVFRNFPFDRPALSAAVLAECGGNERYFSFIGAFFQQQDNWARAQDPVAALIRIAKLGGLSEEKAQACLKDEQLANRVVAQRLTGEKDLGVNSTPTFFINGRQLVGAQEYSKYNEMLQAAGAKS